MRSHHFLSDVVWPGILWSTIGLVAFVALLCRSASAQLATKEPVEFFEKHIRPVLADKCYRCHGDDPEKIEGGLNLTYKNGLLSGGDRGPALMPGSVTESLIIRAIRYDDAELQMPPNGKLPADVIAHFKKWVAIGAPDPRERPSASTALDDAVTWESVVKERRKWWSFQPIKSFEPPAVSHADFWEHPVDRFIMAKWEEAGLTPVPLAEPRTLIRRITYVLTGLPPTPEETKKFVASASVNHQAAVVSTVDRLLNSPQFGERWARHWMDWIRYSETHGSEGDPPILHAWQYRDYLIRALNADVPYDRLVREHLAGDTMNRPRINHELGLNESAIGTCQYRFVQHGYSPTDALDEQVRFTENQIDVISKAFLGLTVACARCHNHKFDAISQKDFYALYGIMASSRPAVITIDTARQQDKNKAQLSSLKPQLRAVLAKEWLRAAAGVAGNLLRPENLWEEHIEPPDDNDHEDEEEYDDAAAANYREGKAWRSPHDPLYVWRRLRMLDGAALKREWTSLVDQWRASNKRLRDISKSEHQVRWDLTGKEAAEWFGLGNGVTSQPSSSGEFTVWPEGDRIVGNVLPAGVYSHTLSDKHSAVFASPRFNVNKSKVFVRIIGGGNALARYVVQNYPLFGETFPVTVLEDGVWRWQEWDAAYWEGDHLHIEMATAADQPVLEELIRERSWFGISEAIVVEDGQSEPRDEVAYFISPLFQTENEPQDVADLAQRYATTLRDCIEAWRDGTTTDAQARFLDYFVAAGLLPNDTSAVPAAASLLSRYRALEAEVPIPTRVAAVMEGDSFDQPLFVRGNHREPSDPVERRFLEAIDNRPYEPSDAGRRQLAESILDSSNPLTARVIVNRLWHHTFGRGIVATPDNFGQLGEPPSHPELLDYLANWFVSEGWSIKKILRLLTTSRTFQLRTLPSANANAIDPTNRLFSHASLRRLEAEAIRDSMLMVAGRLDLTRFGEPVDGTEDRRSVYVHVSRNSPDPLLAVFDAPVPTSTTGRRYVTNVPAQALSMMNSAYVHDLAHAFAARVKDEDSSATKEDRIGRMFELALGRSPSETEVASADAFLAAASTPEFKSRNREQIELEIALLQARIEELATLSREEEALEEETKGRERLGEEREEEREEKEKGSEEEDERDEQRKGLEREIERLTETANVPDAWHELALAIFCMKEFIYLR